MFHFYTADGSKTEVIAVERAAPHSTSPTHAAETRNSLKKYVLKDLERNMVSLPGTHFAASGTFVDPLNTSGMMEPKCYNKEAFLKEVVEREPGVTIQDKVTKGRGGHPRHLCCWWTACCAPPPSPRPARTQRTGGSLSCPMLASLPPTTACASRCPSDSQRDPLACFAALHACVKRLTSMHA